MSDEIRLFVSAGLMGAGAYMATVGAVAVRFCRTGAIYDFLDDVHEESLERTAKSFIKGGLLATVGGLALGYLHGNYQTNDPKEQ